LEGAIVPAEKYKILYDACQEDSENKIKTREKKKISEVTQNWMKVFKKVEKICNAQNGKRKRREKREEREKDEKKGGRKANEKGEGQKGEGREGEVKHKREDRGSPEARGRARNRSEERKNVEGRERKERKKISRSKVPIDLIEDKISETPKKIAPKKPKEAGTTPTRKKKATGKKKSGTTASTPHEHVLEIISTDAVTGITKKMCACGFVVSMEEI
jgi:hypothetical protein